MRFTAPASLVRPAFDKVARLCPRNSPNVAAQSVRLDVDEKSIRLTGTNLEVYATASVGVGADTPGSVLLPRELVGKILAHSGDSELEFAADGAAFSVRGGGGEFEAQTAPAETFPSVPSLPPGDHPSATVQAIDLPFLEKRVGKSAADSDFKGWHLASACVGWSGRVFSLETTDGTRTSHQDIEAETSGECPPRTWLIPARSLALLPSLLTEGPVRMVFPDCRVAHCVGADMHVVVRLAEGRFPPFEAVEAKAADNLKLPIDVKAWQAAVERVLALTSEETRGIYLEATPAGFRLSGRLAGRAEGRVTIPADVSVPTPPPPVRVSGRYLADVLKSIGSGVPATISLGSPASPVGFLADGYRHFIAPMEQDR